MEETSEGLFQSDAAEGAMSGSSSVCRGVRKRLARPPPECDKWAMPKRTSTGDINETATAVLQPVTGAVPETSGPPKNAAAVALGRLGGLKGGPARAAALGPERRKEIAHQAARKRWGNP